MYTSFNLAAAAYTPVLLIVRKIRYLLIEFTENVLYRDVYRYRDMNDLYRDMTFWSYRPALRPIRVSVDFVWSRVAPSCGGILGSF